MLYIYHLSFNFFSLPLGRLFFTRTQEHSYTLFSCGAYLIMVQVIKIETKLDKMFRYTERALRTISVETKISLVNYLPNNNLGVYRKDTKQILLLKDYYYTDGGSRDCQAYSHRLLHEVVHACQRQTGKSLFKLYPKCPREETIPNTGLYLLEWEAYSYEWAYIYSDENYKHWLNKLVDLYS